MRFYLALGLIALFGWGCNRANSLDHKKDIPQKQNSVALKTGDWYKPKAGASWQWQLQGEVNTTYNVDIYNLDLVDTPRTLIRQLQAQNKKVICYFSAGSFESWRPDAARFEAAVLGNPLDGWANERWLDIRSDNVRSIMESRLNLARQKGCDGVEPDNIDGYVNNSGFSLSFSDQLAFNRWLADQVHSRNLAVGLKNDLDQIKELEPYFDFAVNEQCFEYAECDALTPFIKNGKPVLNAEYQQQYVDNSAARNNLCVQSRNLQFSTLILPLDLDDKFRYDCLTVNPKVESF